MTSLIDMIPNALKTLISIASMKACVYISATVTPIKA